MNLVLDAISDVVAGSERRMDAIRVPKIVRQRCPFCMGSGLREIGKGPLGKLDTCAACYGKGFVNVEAA